jgi:gliding motility-associated-like protein
MIRINQTINTVTSQLSILFIVLLNMVNAQAPTCPTNSILAHNGNFIYGHSLPNGPLTNVLNNLPPGASGLAVGPAFNFPAPNPTWWTTSGGTYWYYNNGGTWTNTGHSTGNGAAVNICGGGSRLYNLVGANGGIYIYNGTGNGTLLTNLVPAFNGGGPYDIVADMANNFFILKSAVPNQGVYVYNPQGVLTCSWSAVGMISQSAGGGFSILQTANPLVHRVYYNSNGTDYIGDIIPGNTSINFTIQTLPNGSDYAQCAIPVPQGTVTAPLGGVLSCTLPSIPLVAGIIPNGSISWMGSYNTATNSPVTPTCGGIQWEGPGPSNTAGIVSGQGTPTIIVNQPGVYTFTWSGCNGCPGYSITASYTVTGQGASIIPVITAPTCISNPTQIWVTPNTATNTILWTGPGIVGPNNTPTITINTAGIYAVSLSVPNSACAGSASIQINQTPTVSISASSTSVCALPSNNSPNSITLTASGAGSYTWSNITGLILTAGSNTSSIVSFTPDANMNFGGVTLIGSNGTCSNSATFSLSIIPNPSISVTSGSVCSGNSYTLVASNASSYSWSPSTGLNSTTAATVIATTLTTSIYSVVGSSAGCNSSTQNATLAIVPNPIISISPATNTICQGNNINLFAIGATNYTWSPSSSLNAPFGASVNASPMTTTNYTIIGEQATCTTSAVYQVSVIALPSIQIVASMDTICQNNSVILTANGASTYSWSPSTGLNTVLGNQVTASPTLTTIYQVAGSNGQCMAFGQITIVVVPFPNLNLSTPNYKICKTYSTSIYASGADYYTWAPLNGLYFNQPSAVSASPLSSTNYTVRGINKLGSKTCSMAKEILIEVVPQVTANISNSLSICQGQSVKLFAGGGNTYSWSPSDGLNQSDIFNPYAMPKTTIVYSVEVSNSGNCAATKTVLVRVNPNPTVTAGEDFAANLDEPMYIYALSSGTVSWVAGEGIMCISCPSTQIFPKKSGCYIAEAINGFGCKSRDELCVEVTSNYNIYIPNIFTPNGDGNNDVFLVYGTGLAKFEMTIFDRWGEKLFESKEQLIGWDGSFKGEICKNDAYPYLIKYQALDGKTHTRSGHVTLLK